MASSGDLCQSAPVGRGAPPRRIRGRTARIPNGEARPLLHSRSVAFMSEHGATERYRVAAMQISSLEGDVVLRVSSTLTTLGALLGPDFPSLLHVRHEHVMAGLLRLEHPTEQDTEESRRRSASALAEEIVRIFAALGGF